MGTQNLRVSVFIAVSLDGFIARADGDVSWLQAGEPLPDGEDAGFAALLKAVDALVIGRASFEKVLEFDWPYSKKPVIVLSKSLKEVPVELRDWVRVDSSNPQELVDKLRQDGYTHIYLDGGKVVRSFLREGLVDDITLTTIPVLIGEGLPLFGRLDADVKLRLLASRSWSNGYVQSKYQVLK